MRWKAAVLGRRITPDVLGELDPLVVEPARTGDYYLFIVVAWHWIDPDVSIRGSLFRRRFWAPAIKAAGLPPLRVHDLRHTAVSLWIAGGGNPKQVAVRAGHSSVSVVFDRYGHLYPQHDDELMAALERSAAALTSASA